ncbi:MAG: Gfo/Idh/MocA family protein [Phycisphaerae bacterium]
MAEKIRYAHVGVGGRSRMYTKAIYESFPEIAELVAICDINHGRMELKNEKIKELGGEPVPMYDAADFDKMVEQTKPDRIIVTTGPDATHSDYIVRAMELGCDVVTEKPMTTDEEKCRRILDTIQKTGRNVQVTFNYRYAPHRSQVKEILDSGEIGDILSVDFTWPLDTRHGADYFRRWHRRRENSGSLLVHKSTHHFDLVNWWLGDTPAQVFCHATNKFYTPQMGDELGLTERTERCHTCPYKNTDDCKFSLDLEGTENLKALYLDNEHEDGYYRDRCVFSEHINIWDNMSLSVKYSRGAVMNYFLHAYSPWEGYQIAFNGTKGRLEHGSTQFSYISGEQESATPGELKKEGTYIMLHPHFGEPKSIPVHKGEGGHGGGDPVLLRDIFDPDAPADPLHRKANHVDGSWSILTGIAAYYSIDRGDAVDVPKLIEGSTL